MSDARASVPTPGDVALSHRTPGPAAYDRHAWEAAVIATSGLHNNARLIAFLLAHYADETGHLPAGGPQNAERLAKDTNLQGRFARISLNALENDGLIRRPSITDWTDRGVRPVTLTMPTVAAASKAPSPGERL